MVHLSLVPLENNAEVLHLNMKLTCLPLRPSTLALLTRRGFISANDLFQSSGIIPNNQSSSCDANDGYGSMSNLAAELSVPIIEAASIFREVDAALRSFHSASVDVPTSAVGEPKLASLTAASLLQSALGVTPPLPQGIRNSTESVTTPIRPIVSFVQSIDTMLGGGFYPRELTELAGPPGSGKTQLAMQLCVDARLPREFGGVAGSAVYIDSEGSFSPERCWTMAKVRTACAMPCTLCSVISTVYSSFAYFSVSPPTSADSKNKNITPLTLYPRRWWTMSMILRNVRPHDQGPLSPIGSLLRTFWRVLRYFASTTKHHKALRYFHCRVT